MMSDKLTKKEKLKSRKKIESLFKEGKGIKKFPVLLVHNSDFSSPELPQVAFSVSKRNFKLAVDRNRFKRLMRESYRIMKSDFDQSHMPSSSMFIYIARERFDLGQIEVQMRKILKELNSSEKGQS